MKSYWEEKAYEDIEDSSGWNDFILLILTIGMSTIKGDATRIVEKSQVLKLTESRVLTWEKHIEQHLCLLIFGLVFGWVG
jgi:hypothetical protein